MENKNNTNIVMVSADVVHGISFKPATKSI